MSEPAIRNCIHCGADPAEIARLREALEEIAERHAETSWTWIRARNVLKETELTPGETYR